MSIDAFCMPDKSPVTVALTGLIGVGTLLYYLFRPRAGPRGGERQNRFRELMKIPETCALVAAICGGLAFLVIFHAHGTCPSVAVAASFRSGTQADPPLCFQNRSFPVDVFHPTFPSGSYVLLEGPHGCGKTTAIQWQAHAAGAGVVYASVVDATTFGYELASTFHLDDGSWWTLSSLPISFQSFSQMNVIDAVSRICDFIRDIGPHLSQELNKPLVLIIDNSARLAKLNPEVLYLLQDFAKDSADEGWLRVIFSASEGLVPHILQARSSSSRMVVKEMGDVNSTVAVEYLKCRGIPEATAEQAVNVTGGRFAMLQQAASSMLAGRSVHSLEETLRAAVAMELNEMGVVPESKLEWRETQERSKALWEVAQHIISHGYMSTSQYRDIVTDLNDQKLFQASNIFLFDHKKKKVTFQSRPVELYMRSGNSAKLAVQ
jgi:hypothetical protein